MITQQQQKLIKTTLDQAVKLHDAGQWEQAETIYRNVIQQFPQTAEAYNLLGTLYHHKGKHRVAVELTKKAIKLSPKIALYYNSLGNALRESGEGREAEKAFRKALKIKPDYTSAMNNLGGSVLAKGNISSAISVFIKTLKINPEYYPARHNLGVAYFEKGENDKALDCYRTVMKQKPSYTKSVRNLAETKKFKNQDADFKHLEELARNNNFGGEDKANILFSFAKAQDDQQLSKPAFETYLKANRAFRNTFQYSIDQTRKDFDEIKASINKDFFETYREESKESRETSSKPVFVLGMPRSGTSLVEQILSSHPKVFGAGELNFVAKIYFHLIREKGTRNFSDAFSNCDSSFLKDLGNNYNRQISELPTKLPFIVDKMPRNFIYAGLLKIMLPNAKIIHCRRSPEDTCLSIFKKIFVGQQHFAYNLEELAQYYNLYLDMMDHWRDLLGDDLYEINYEDLISDQKKQTENLLSHCGLEWHDACLDFHKTKRLVRTASTDQVRQPLYQTSVQAWKKYEGQLGPLITILEERRKRSAG